MLIGEERFGNPAEFGLQYLLCGPYQNRVRLAWANVLPGLYYFLGCAPDFSAVFPWVRLMLRHSFGSPDHDFPPEYFIEPTAGALYLAPLIVAAVPMPSRRRAPTPVRVVLGVMLASSSLILFFLAATGFTSQRYEVDFLPMLLAAGSVNLALWHPAIPRAVVAIAICFGVVVGLALGLTGPYDDMLKNRPVNYLWIARWFSPVTRYRPVLNPHIAAGFNAESAGAAQREPLLTMGRQAYRYFLYAERAGSGVRIVSQCEQSRIAREIDGTRPLALEVQYDPEFRTVSVTVNGESMLVHRIGGLVTAPDDVTIGENRIEPNLTPRRFTGRITGAWMTIQ